MSQNPVPPGLEIPPTDPLRALQHHVGKLCTHFGWDKASNGEVFLLFMEEIGELAKAIRNHDRLFEEKGKASKDEATLKADLEEEFADILSYLFDLANRYKVDLAKAYSAKTEANFTRNWK